MNEIPGLNRSGVSSIDAPYKDLLVFCILLYYLVWKFWLEIVFQNNT